MNLKIAIVSMCIFCTVSHSRVYGAPSPGSEFSIRLFKAIAEPKSEENLVVSPYAIRLALGLAASGARGRTQRQLSRIPDLWGPKNSSTRLLVANRLWIQNTYSVFENFLEAAENNFSARPWFVDFTKAPDFLKDRVNGWVSERTMGKISEMINEDSIDSSMRMVLSSASYFRGNWLNPFERVANRDNFETEGPSGRVKVPFIHKKGSFSYAENQNAQILEIPYSDGELSMLILLPTSETSLKTLERELTAETLDRWLVNLAIQDVNVSLPKFDFDSSNELVAPLKSLGINDPFELGLADFSGMTGKKDLFVSRVFHKTTLALTEEGTEISSGELTVAGRNLASDHSSIPFKANHPFMFLIRHKVSNLIFFAGHLAKF